MLKYEFTHETETIQEEEKYYADNNASQKALTQKQRNPHILKDTNRFNNFLCLVNTVWMYIISKEIIFGSFPHNELVIYTLHTHYFLISS